MTLETRFLQIFGYKILSLIFVQNDGSKTKKENRQTREIALSCVDGFSGLWGLFFWQSQNFTFDQLIGLVKGVDHLGRFLMEIDFI